VKLTTIARAWAVELWLNARYEPWKILPHPCRPYRAAGDGYRCERCGSRSARVQRKGQALRERLRRELA
jgi:hypothetical protein